MFFYHLLRFTVHAICLLYFRIEFHGSEHVPLDGPVILAPNHASYLDPIWVSIPIRRRLRYMTWDRMFRIPLLAPLMRAFGAFPVNIKVGDRGALRLSLEHLQQGGALMIFPEGSRTRTGQMLPFKHGMIRLALESGAPIIPVTIVGGYKALSPQMRFPRPAKIKIFYHAPLKLDLPAEHAEIKGYIRTKASEIEALVAARM